MSRNQPPVATPGDANREIGKALADIKTKVNSSPAPVHGSGQGRKNVNSGAKLGEKADGSSR